MAPEKPLSFYIGRVVSNIKDEGRRHGERYAKHAIALTLTVVGAYWCFIVYSSRSDMEGRAASQDAPGVSVAGSVQQSGSSDALSPLSRGAQPAAKPVGRGSSGGEGVATASAASQLSDAGDSLAVEVRASALVWIRTLSDDAPQREVTLRAGEKHTFRANESVKMTLGSAGAASLLVNGVELGDIGAMGQVRHLQITSDGWSYLPPGSF